MTPQQKQERREKIMRRLMDDIHINWCKIQTHLAKKEVVESTCQGFLGYKK